MFSVVVPLTKHCPRAALAAGLAIQALSGLLMARLDINLTSFDVLWTNALQGFGFGLAFALTGAAASGAAFFVTSFAMGCLRRGLDPKGAGRGGAP